MIFQIYWAWAWKTNILDLFSLSKNDLHIFQICQVWARTTFITDLSAWANMTDISDLFSLSMEDQYFRSFQLEKRRPIFQICSVLSNTIAISQICFHLKIIFIDSKTENRVEYFRSVLKQGRSLSQICPAWAKTTDISYQFRLSKDDQYFRSVQLEQGRPVGGAGGVSGGSEEPAGEGPADPTQGRDKVCIDGPCELLIRRSIDKLWAEHFCNQGIYGSNRTANIWVEKFQSPTIL